MPHPPRRRDRVKRASTQRHPRLSPARHPSPSVRSSQGCVLRARHRARSSGPSPESTASGEPRRMRKSTTSQPVRWSRRRRPDSEKNQKLVGSAFSSRSPTRYAPGDGKRRVTRVRHPSREVHRQVARPGHPPHRRRARRTGEGDSELGGEVNVAPSFSEAPCRTVQAEKRLFS